MLHIGRNSASRCTAGRMSHADNVISFAFKRITHPILPKRQRPVKLATDHEIN